MDDTEDIPALRREYRTEVEENLLGDSIRSAMLLFIVLQTAFFIPADWILFREHFGDFLVVRLVENALLVFLYFKWSYVSPVQSTAISSLTGAGIFLFMVHMSGGVESGYYVGLILLLVGIALLTPLSGIQGGLIAGTIFTAYAFLPWISHRGETVNWNLYVQHLIFLGSVGIEAALACLLMDRMRFREFKQRRELTTARDELAELDRAKSRFSANIHHELRTPLTLILSPLDALRSGEFGPVPEYISSTLDTMHSNGRRLHKMINNLLDLSKLESRQFEIVRRPTRIDRLINELVESAKPMAERKGVQLTSICLDQPIEVAIDSEAIEKVIINLLGNALKFTESGGRVSVKVEVEPEGDGIHIRVVDDGIGIPSEQITSIFDRFAQVDSSATRKFEGTGIGLSLAKEMVQMHGGRIWAESLGQGSGTTMNVWLPSGMTDRAIEEDVLTDDTGRALGIRDSITAMETDLNLDGFDFSIHRNTLGDIERQIDRSNDRTERSNHFEETHEVHHGPESGEVLIAEDNPDMRQLLSALIGSYYRVRLAKNGLEALTQARESAPDLILSDVMMPEMDGTELCREIKGDPKTSSIPIILVTSKAEGEMKVEGLELGANDYVTKPFHPRELLARVGSLVRSNSLRKELSIKNDELVSALSELKRAEQQLVQNERLAAVGELAAGIAHEVNNPVNFSLNAARMLAKSAKDFSSIAEHFASESETLDEKNSEEIMTIAGEVEELASIVSQGLERTQSLVANLRDFASNENCNTPREIVDIRGCVKAASSLVRPTLSASGIDLSVIAPPNPQMADVDETAITQVILNLLKNASDAIGDGGGLIEVELCRKDRLLCLSISDSGPGIPLEHRKRLFEPFFTTKPTGSGTGLGLAFCRRVALDHGGTLELDPTSGEGSRFTLTIEAAPPKAPPPPQSP